MSAREAGLTKAFEWILETILLSLQVLFELNINELNNMNINELKNPFNGVPANYHITQQNSNN